MSYHIDGFRMFPQKSSMSCQTIPLSGFDLHSGQLTWKWNFHTFIVVYLWFFHLYIVVYRGFPIKNGKSMAYLFIDEQIGRLPYIHSGLPVFFSKQKKHLSGRYRLWLQTTVTWVLVNIPPASLLWMVSNGTGEPLPEQCAVHDA